MDGLERNSKPARHAHRLTAIAILSLWQIAVAALGADDPLLSWNDTGAKKAILDFVAEATTEGSPDFVRPEERVGREMKFLSKDDPNVPLLTCLAFFSLYRLQN